MKDYSLNQSAMSINHFALLLKEGNGIDLDAPYQRGHVWGVERQQALIFSLLAGVPISTIIVNNRFSNFPNYPADGVYYAVIDGKQRITAMQAFMNSEFAIPATWVKNKYLPENHGETVTYEELGQAFDRHFKNRPVAYIEAHLTSIDEEKEVFDLINYGGLPQGQSDFD